MLTAPFCSRGFGTWVKRVLKKHPASQGGALGNPGNDLFGGSASELVELGGSKNRGFLPPKWMVKIMENPIK